MTTRLVLGMAILCSSPAFGQTARREPNIGYAYPAGGCQGSRFQILVGGQNLKGVKEVHITGTGVKASVVKYFRPLGNLDGDERKAIQSRMREVFEMKLAALPPAVRSRIPQDRELAGLRGEPARKKERAVAATRPALPEHPLFLDWENKSIRELLSIRDELTNYRKRQPNAQIAESVLIEVSIDPKAMPGDRDLRLVTSQGLTNPICFQVGSFPEHCEEESNDPGAHPLLPAVAPFEVPVTVNGQVKPGDVDRVAFRARRGQKLVIQAFARHLVPYLADAVPGWFQATVTLFNSAGQEVAFADDYRFNPDPVLYYEVPEDGKYELEIRDSIFRGRDDFVYRIVIAEQPFITSVFPLGGRTGSRTVASAEGWNLRVDEFQLVTPPGAAGPRQVTVKQQEQISNPVIYSVDMLPECAETEPNDSTAGAQTVELPKIINGRIEKPGDTDVFAFEGRAGQEIVVETNARRLQSPLDSLVQLIDVNGKVVAWNDDVEQLEDKESGLLTHHADSYLRARVPENGTCYVQLTDAQQHGGEAYSYRLRISAPRPDFALRATPSSLSLQAGWAAPLWVYALRKDGFDGEIQIVLKDSSTGFTLGGAKIPRGQDRVRLTVTAPKSGLNEPVCLELQGVAKIAGQTVRRKVVPAEDMMQAFAYHHLVPVQALVAEVASPRRWAPTLDMEMNGPVRVTVGGTSEVRLTAPPRPRLPDLRFELRDPPAGVTLQPTRYGDQNIVLKIKAGANAPAGTIQNLVVEAFINPPASQPGSKEKGPRQRVSLGLLPAIPIEITKR